MGNFYGSAAAIHEVAEGAITPGWHGDRTAAAPASWTIKEDLVAKRAAIESYGDMIALIDEKDSRTRCLLNWILAQEREHADALDGWLKSFDEQEARG